MALSNISDIRNLIPSNESLLGQLTPELTSKLADLILIIKAAGILFIIYVLFLIFGSIIRIIERRRIKKIYEKVNAIDEKLDTLISEKKHDGADFKEVKIAKKDKKK